MFNINKPNKIQVVFDAAAKFNGTSLNDRLYHGPDLTNNLVGVLIRFRQEKIAFTANIEAIFHQVKVLPKDADALRFLWWNDSLDQPSVDYQTLVHIFGATSSPCCANKALKQTAEDNKPRLSPEAVKTDYLRVRQLTQTMSNHHTMLCSNVLYCTNEVQLNCHHRKLSHFHRAVIKELHLYQPLFLRFL